MRGGGRRALGSTVRNTKKSINSLEFKQKFSVNLTIDLHRKDQPVNAI